MRGERQTDRQTDRQTNRDRERGETDRQTDRHRDREFTCSDDLVPVVRGRTIPASVTTLLKLLPGFLVSVFTFSYVRTGICRK